MWWIVSITLLVSPTGETHVSRETMRAAAPGDCNDGRVGRWAWLQYLDQRTQAPPAGARPISLMACVWQDPKTGLFLDENGALPPEAIEAARDH